MTKRIKLGLVPGGSALIIVFAIAAVLSMSVSGYAQSTPYVIAASSSPAALPAATSDEADEPILTIVFAIAAVLSMSVSGYAQSTPYVTTASSSPAALPAATSDEADEPILTIKKRVDEVNVLFIATDRHGKFVRNLNQNDFSIFDDHKPVQSILNFRRETDLPIELGLLMDVSGSVQGRFGFEKDAATGFLQHIIRPGYDRAFVVGFNKESRLTQDFTD